MPPDVSVIIAVYNTATYLPESLASLERQTLGFDRLQVILVDDGSYDGSERIVDEFAARHRENTVVIHQPNSGTPSVPFNRGLDRATGRWVFFLGSDDVLDDDALQVLVEHGDAWESDVIFGRLEPIGDRKVPVAIYRAGRVADLDFYSSRLPYNLSNTKLFRRSLIEDLGLRYREDMRQRCDQPFVITALVNARRISMIGDGAVYRARAREDRSNVTYTADEREYYRSTEIIMDTVAECLEPGERRDHVMQRMFDNTIRGELRDQHRHRGEQERAFVYDQIARLSERYLTDRIFRSMKVHHRVIIAAALRRDSEVLTELLRVIEETQEPVPIHVRGDRAWFAYPGFDPTSATRDAYEITHERPVARVARQFLDATVDYAGGRLRIGGRTLLQGEPTVRGRLVKATAPSQPTVSTDRPRRGRRIDAHVDTDAGTYRLEFDPSDLPDREFRPTVLVRVAGRWYDVPLRFHGVQDLRRGLIRRRRVALARADADGHLCLDLR